MSAVTNFLNFTSLCNRRSVAVLDRPQLVYALMELSPGAETGLARLPLNFALVLDHSGSMAGEKLRTLKAAVKNLIDQLQPDDIISIVLFESRTRVLVPAYPASDREALKAAVDQIREAGGTNLAPGLREGLRLVSQQHTPQRLTRLIVLTDGEATDKPEESQRVAEEAGQLGIPLICLGFGKDWNEQFLFDLADRSIRAEPGSRHGLADYIPTPRHTEEIFQQVFRSMRVIAQEVHVTLRLAQGLEARRVWQVAPLIKDIGRTTIQGRAITIPVGELEQAGVAYLVELMLPPRPPGSFRIAQAEATAGEVGSEGLRQAVDLVIEYSEAPDDRTEDRVMNIVEKVQAFKLQTQALGEAESGNIGAATQKLRQAVTLLLAQGEAELAGQMLQEAQNLEQRGQISSEGKKTILLTSRKTVKMSEDGSG